MNTALKQKLRLGRSTLLGVLHLFIVPAFGSSLWSGLNLAIDQRPMVKQFLYWWPGMDRVVFWHILSGVVIICLTGVYVVFRFILRQNRASKPELRLTNNFSMKVKHGLYLSVGLLVVTGIMQLTSSFGAGFFYTRGLHLLSAVALTLLLILHIGVEWITGTWRQIRYLFFDIHRQAIRTSIVSVLTFALVISFALLGLHGWQGGSTLVASRVKSGFQFDGSDEEAQWKNAKSRTVNTYFGFPYSRVVPVEIKAVHDGFGLYIFAKWPDSSASSQHLPLQKTEQGWQILHDGALQNDEIRYYEDKFAVMLGSNRWDALKSVFLNATHGRGGHHMPKGEMVDVWHWKSVRNRPFGNLDDAFFGALLPSMPLEQRYTWGYASDPLLAGGWKSNWSFLKDGVIEPLRLPRAEYGLGALDVQREKEKHALEIGLHWNKTQPYDASLDVYRTGALLPSVVWEYANNGDRGSVRAVGRWHAGFWHLEMYRNFASESEFDQEIKDGLYFWFSTFDHCQTRHTYHLRPLRLELGK